MLNVSTYVGEETYNLGTWTVYITTEPRSCNLYRMKDSTEEFRMLEIFKDRKASYKLWLYRGGGKRLQAFGLSEPDYKSIMYLLDIHDSKRKHTIVSAVQYADKYNVTIDWTCQH